MSITSPDATCASWELATTTERDAYSTAFLTTVKADMSGDTVTAFSTAVSIECNSSSGSSELFDTANSVWLSNPRFVIASTPTPTPRPVTFAALGEREWRLIVKAPDDYEGNGYVVWACVTQFDAATGEGSFLGQASYMWLAYWFSEGDNAWFDGDPDLLKNVVEDDIVVMNVVSKGSFSYDTQIGGNTTVPAFEVRSVTVKGSC